MSLRPLWKRVKNLRSLARTLQRQPYLCPPVREPDSARPSASVAPPAFVSLYHFHFYHALLYLSISVAFASPVVHQWTRGRAKGKRAQTGVAASTPPRRTRPSLWNLPCVNFVPERWSRPSSFPVAGGRPSLRLQCVRCVLSAVPHCDGCRNTEFTVSCSLLAAAARVSSPCVEVGGAHRS